MQRLRPLWTVSLLVALLPSHASPQPTVLFTDLESGPTVGGPGNLGAPIAIFGSGFGATRGRGRVTIGGVEVARYIVWGSGNATNPMLDMIVVQPGAGVTGGPIVVEVDGLRSNADHRFVANRGRVLYVATNGNDGNAGTEQAPFATILHAVGSARSGPGDVILVRGGTYGEGEIWIRDSEGAGGARGQAKAIVAHPGETVILNNPARDVYLDASYITVSGLHLRNGKVMGMYDSATGLDFEDGIKIINCSVIGPISHEGLGTPAAITRWPAIWWW